MRVEAHGYAHLLFRLDRVTSREQRLRGIDVAPGIAWIERDGRLELLLGIVVPAKRARHVAGDLMRCGGRMFLGDLQVIARPAVGIPGRHAQVPAPALVVGLEIDHRQRRVGAGIGRVELDRLLEIRKGLEQFSRRRALVVIPSAQEGVICFQRRGFMASQRASFAGGQAQRHGVDDGARHLVLQREDVGQ